MSLRIFLCVALLSAALPAAAQDRGYWRAANSNATTITGDIDVGEARLSIDFFNFPLAHIRTLTPTEVSAVFDADIAAGQIGQLYRLSVPATHRFLKRNTLCGSDDTQWMATFVTGHYLRVAFFSGPETPVLTIDALAKSTDLCGIFVYER